MATATKDASPNFDDSHISCPVCLDVFKTPKSLHCGHSLCEECYQNLLKTMKDKIIECPECRKPTKVPADGLSTNYALQNLIVHLDKDDGRLRCVDCRKTCDPNEAWIKYDKNDIIHSFRNAKTSLSCQACVNKKFPNALPASIKKLSDAIDNVLQQSSNLSPDSAVWANKVHEAVANVKHHLDAIVAVGHLLEEYSFQDIITANRNGFQRFQPTFRWLCSIIEEVDDSKRTVMLDALANWSSAIQHVKSVEDKNRHDTLEKIKELSNALEALAKQGADIQPGNSNLKAATLAAKISSMIKYKPDDPKKEVAHHVHTICEGCQKDVYGIRFKCLICDNFDLCSDCQEKRLHDDHPMIRIARPEDEELWKKAFCAGHRWD